MNIKLTKNKEKALRARKINISRFSWDRRHRGRSPISSGKSATDRENIHAKDSLLSFPSSHMLAKKHVLKNDRLRHIAFFLSSKFFH